MVELTSRDYEIPDALLDDLHKKINGLNRRAARLNAAPITVVTGESYMKQIWTRDPADPLFDPQTDFMFRPTTRVTVTGEAPQLNGWQFAATIQHSEITEGQSANLLRKAPSFELELPAEFRTSDPGRCDHCHQYRVRHDTYIVYRADTSEFAQVGSNCLGDFTGAKSPHAIAAWLEVLLDLDRQMAEFEDDSLGSKRDLSLPLERFVAVVAAVIRTEGWLSRSKAREINGLGGRPVMATADIAAGQFNNPYLKAEDKISPTEADLAEAKAAIEWARETWNPTERDLSDYEWTMYVVMQNDWVEPRRLGFAASVINARRRATEQEIERTRAIQNKANDWFGEDGQKVQLLLTLVRRMEVDGLYGLKVGHIFEDAEGRCFTWWASGTGKDVLAEADLNKTFAVKGTIKDHSEYKGRKQTNLTRCKTALAE